MRDSLKWLWIKFDLLILSLNSEPKQIQNFLTYGQKSHTNCFQNILTIGSFAIVNIRRERKGGREREEKLSLFSKTPREKTRPVPQFYRVHSNEHSSARNHCLVKRARYFFQPHKTTATHKFYKDSLKGT